MIRTGACHQRGASPDSFLELVNTHTKRCILSEAHTGRGGEKRNGGRKEEREGEKHGDSMIAFELPNLAILGAKMSPSPSDFSAA